MKRWLASLFIAGYLSALGFGLASHTLGIGVTQHPLMYFVVWDMFCGWSAFGNRLHLVGEGESGKYYELAPGPWGEFYPYGPTGRQHYDSFVNHMGRLGMNTLAHTEHEPILRMFVIEEAWPKKFDLPDYIWNAQYDEPKDPQSYYHLRMELAHDGSLRNNYAGWYTSLEMSTVTENPRLQAEMRSTQSFFVVDQAKSGSRIQGVALPLSEYGTISGPAAN